MKMQSSPDLVLRKALRLLIHPFTLLAFVLLLLNDHLLRRLWPSAITGKLGDFAWLFLIPLAVLAALALITPGRGPRRARALPLVAYASVALTYTLAKTLPAIHDLVVSTASGLFGFPVGWRLDPSDLIALVSLGLSALLWARTPAPQEPSRVGAPAGWLALIAAALLTVANSPAPDPGIYCLDERAGEVDAFAGYATYRSTDGGLTWAPLPNQARGACPNPWESTSGQMLTVADPNSPQRQYRVTPGQSIELSDDGGATWRMIYQIPRVNEATAAVTRRRLSSYATIRPVPLDATVDRTTGNAVFAMGHAGVLVLEPSSGAWREVGVGTYQPAPPGSPADYLGLLIGEILLAVAVILLAFATLATRLFVRGKGLWITALVLAWLIWAATVFVFPPALSYGYGAMLTYGAMLVLGVILLVLTVIGLVGSFQHAKGDVRSVVGRPALAALAAGVFFLLPYALWAANVLAVYVLGSVFGTLLAVGAVIAGARWARQAHDQP